MSNWYAAYTKPRSEKKAAERLTKNGWEVYCPLKKEIRQWSDRKKKVEVPFFSSYIFVRLDNYEKRREEVLRDPALLNFVYWQRKPAIISDKEMDEVMAFFEKYNHQEIKADRLEVGGRLELGDGPFAGKQGVITKVGANKVTLLLEQIGIQLTVDMHSSSTKQ